MAEIDVDEVIDVVVVVVVVVVAGFVRMNALDVPDAKKKAMKVDAETFIIDDCNLW